MTRLLPFSAALALIVAGTVPGAAPAQVRGNLGNDDVRCLLLSAGFARAAKDETTRRGAAMTGSFFLGRVTGRLQGAALTAAIRAQGKGLSAQQAGPIMRACAARATAAEKALSAAARQAEAGR